MPDHAVDQVNGGIGPRDGSSELNDTVRRHAYLIVSGLLVASLARTLVAGGFGVPYWGPAYPILTVLGAAMFVGVWRRWLSLWAFEAVLLGMVATALSGFLATWRVTPAYVAADATRISLVVLWSGLVFPLAFLVFGARRGLQMSVAFYAAIVLLVGPRIIDASALGDAQMDTVDTHISFAVFFAVMIVLLWVLASRLEATLAMSRSAARHFASQASTDTLTGVPNRRQLDDQLDRDIARAQRDREPLSVLLVDVDRFKAINDVHGHHAGDRALRELASGLSDTVRAGDVAGRWGGDEFLLIAPKTDQEGALELAERCRTAMADTLVADVGEVTASFGVATLGDDEDARSLMRRADTALYAAKDGGGDAVAGTPDLGT